MKLHHQSEVAASPQHVWEFFQDTPAVMGCLPGAELVEEKGDDRYEGVLHVAVGPLKMNYAGDVEVVERSASEHCIVLDARGRDKRGSGTVQAHVRLQVEPAGSGTRIDVVSDVDLTGRIASLGRGVRDVSNRMFVEFADRMVDRVEHGPEQSIPDPDTAGTTARVVHKQAGVTTAPAGTAGRPPAVGTGTSTGEIKVLPLVWTITRERLADFLDRLSRRVRPR
ncbi:MAG: SRPBCC family protein [Sciscionella sp.]